MEYKVQKRKVQDLVRASITNHENAIVQEMEQGKDGRKLWENINKLRYGTIKGKNQECKLYDDIGNNLTETEQNGSIINYWRRIYQKHDNQISQDWNEDERLRYRERYGDENLVQRGRYDEDWYTEQFVNRLWRVAQGDRGLLQGGEGELTRRQIISYDNFPEIPGVEWMQEIIFSIEEVKKQLKRLKKGKKAGPNGLKNELYKWLLESDICLSSLVRCLNSAQTLGPPPDWKKSKTVMIPKKDPTNL